VNGQFGDPYRPRRYRTRAPRVNGKPLAKMVFKTFCNPSNSDLAKLEQPTDWSGYRVEPRDGDWNNLAASNLKFVRFVRKANATTFIPGQQPPPRGTRIVSVDVRDGTVHHYANQLVCGNHFECHRRHLMTALRQEKVMCDHFKLFYASAHSQILAAKARGRVVATIMKLDTIPEDFDVGPEGDPLTFQRWTDHNLVRSAHKLESKSLIEARLINEAHMLDAVKEGENDFNAPPPHDAEPQPVDKFRIEPQNDHVVNDGAKLQNRWLRRRQCAVGDGAAAGTCVWNLKILSDVTTVKDVFVGVTAAESALRPGKTVGVNIFGTIVEGDHPCAPKTFHARPTNAVECCVPDVFVRVTFVGSEKLVKFALMRDDDVLWEVEERISIARPRIWASVYRLIDSVRIK
jgi:hypothetical protein